MNYTISDGVRSVLICPACGKSLSSSNEGATCNRCRSHFKNTDSSALDLRLQRRKTLKYEIKVGAPLFPESSFDFGLMPMKRIPEVDFSNLDVPHHLTREMISHFPKAKTNNSLMLDLGCGNAIHRRVCEHAGFEYVGLDYESDKAPILGDAHSLPFRDESFEFILSVAVLEHIRFPFVMMKEAYRVLKPNGVLIGTVAFLEPFHGDSFYHHTHLGTYNSLQEGGFEIDDSCPSDKWSVLIAQAQTGLFPRMPHFLSTLLVMPLYIIHKIWWRLGRNC